MCTAIRIVFDALDNCIDSILVTLEVDNAVTLLVTTTDVTCRDPPGIVTTACLGLLFNQSSERLAFV